MYIYLDTSIYNWLYEQHLVDLVKNNIGLGIKIFPSVYNIAEVASTTSSDRRLALLKILKDLSLSYRPAAMPSTLLHRATVSTLARKPSMDYSAGKDWEGLWISFNNPELLEQADFDEVKAWKKNEEDRYFNILSNGRELMQDTISRLSPNAKSKLTSSFGNLFRYFSMQEDLIRETVQMHGQNMNPKITLDGGQVKYILDNSEYWRFYLSSILHMLYSYSIKVNSFGKKSNPGVVDHFQAPYLAICDVIVSADKRQLRMFKLINRLGNKRRAVWSFDQFKSFILTTREIASKNL